MAVNRNQPHVHVLPEDDANRQIANGFRQQLEGDGFNQMQVLPVAGGWRRVLAEFEVTHAKQLDRWPNRYLILLLDFDDKEDRFQRVQEKIPVGLRDRVFVLGAKGEPEQLKPVLGSYEQIGAKLAADCRDATTDTWTHDLLRHNAPEMLRLQTSVRKTLFP